MNKDRKRWDKRLYPNRGWDQNCLTVNLVYLQERLIVRSDMLSCLKRKNVLNPEDTKLIRSREGKDKVFVLVKLLRTKGQRALETFLNVLQETGQDIVYAYLKNNQSRQPRIQQRFPGGGPGENFLTDNLIYLQEHVNPKALLISHLIQDKVLYFGDEERINYETKRQDKVFVLIKILKSRWQSLNSFLNALEETGQRNIVDDLTKIQPRKPSVQQKFSNLGLDENCLVSNLVYLQEKVHFNGLFLSHLIQDKVLDFKEVDLILCKGRRQVFTLIKLMNQKGPRGLEAFVRALKETGQDVIYDQLKKNPSRQTHFHGKGPGENFLSDNLSYLQEHVNPKALLISYLIQDKVLRFGDEELINSEISRSDKVSLLIKLLRGQRALDAFLSALKATGQRNISDHLRKLQSSQPHFRQRNSMSGSEDNCLNDHLVYLQKNVQIGSLLLPYLIQDRILQDGDAERIKSQTTREDKVFELIEILKPKGKSGLESFLQALKETGQGFICDTLRNKKLERMISQRKHYEPRPPVEGFLERADLEKKIRAMIDEEGKCCLSGPPGSGKTQLARHISQKVVHKIFSNSGSYTLPPLDDSTDNAETFEDSKCMTINASTSREIVKSIQSIISYLSEKMDFDFPSPPNNDDDKVYTVIFQEILRALSTESATHCLVIDDINEDTKDLLPLQDIPQNVVVILTTNDSILYGKITIEVLGFTPEEQLKFFKKNHADCTETDDQIWELAKELGGLPLGLATATKYIKMNEKTIQEYLEQLKSAESRKILHRLESKHLEQYDNVLVVAFGAVIDKLKRNLEPQLFQAISVAMFFNTSSLSVEILKAILMSVLAHEAYETGKKLEWKGEVMIDEIIMNLKQTSLATVTGQGSNRIIQCHSAVPKAWFSHLHEEGSYQRHLELCLLTIAGQFDIVWPFDKQSQLEQENHIEAALLHINSENTNSPHLAILAAIAYYLLGETYINSYHYSKAEATLRQGIDCLCHQVMETSFAVLKSYKSTDDGEYAEAQFVYQILQVAFPDSTMEEICKSFVFHRNFSGEILECWKRLYPKLNGPPKDSFQHNHMTSVLYERLTKEKIVLSERDFRQVFLLEVFVNLLHSMGSLYYNGYTDRKIENDYYFFCLEMAYHLTILAHNNSGISLYITNICERSYLVAIQMRLKDKPRDCLEALRKIHRRYENTKQSQQAQSRTAQLMQSANFIFSWGVVIASITEEIAYRKGNIIKYQRLLLEVTTDSRQRNSIKIQWEAACLTLELIISAHKPKDSQKQISWYNELGHYRASKDDPQEKVAALKHYNEAMLFRHITGPDVLDLIEAVAGQVKIYCDQEKTANASDVLKKYKDHFVPQEEPLENCHDNQTVDPRHLQNYKTLLDMINWKKEEMKDVKRE